MIHCGINGPILKLYMDKQVNGNRETFLWFDSNDFNLTYNIFNFKYNNCMIPLLFTSVDEISEHFHGVSK